MDRPFFSIIYPAFNAGKTLKSAVISMLSSYRCSLEVIIVDDGSTDETAQAAEELIKLFPTVSLCRHGENRGLPAARNTGLSRACGEYVLIPDSDDNVKAGCLAEIQRALSEKPDMLIFGLTEEYYKGEKKTHTNTILPPDAASKSKDETLRLLMPLEENLLLGYAWNKAYRLDFIKANGLQFENIRLVEDILFNLAVIRAGASVTCLPLPLYNYAKREKSITGTDMPDYYPLHKRRAEELWNTALALGGGNRELSRVALRWSRFVLSAVSREKSGKPRRKLIKEIFASPEYGRYAPLLVSVDGNRAERTLTRIIKSKNETALYMLAAFTSAAKRNQKLFTRLKQKPQGEKSVVK